MSTNNFITVVSDGELKQIRYDVFVGLLLKYQSFDLQSLHAAIGITEEAGEVAGVIKKHIIYRKPLDKKKLREELGDLRFYMEALCNLYDLDDQEILQENANKLAARYKELTYSDTAANARADTQGD
jgi:NTP pyrophosphatase (non-canonical NTP hydrolase)